MNAENSEAIADEEADMEEIDDSDDALVADVQVDLDSAVIVDDSDEDQREVTEAVSREMQIEVKEDHSLIDLEEMNHHSANSLQADLKHHVKESHLMVKEAKEDRSIDLCLMDQEEIQEPLVHLASSMQNLKADVTGILHMEKDHSAKRNHSIENLPDHLDQSVGMM